MRIKEVMNKYKVTRKALLLYEERGLIQPDRELSGYRDYRLVDIEVLKKIILLRKMEFSLDEIENIIIYNNKELILNKKNEYEKEAHFIETKKLYLDYIHDVIIGEYEIDEAIDAIDDTLKLYDENKYDDMIHFDYQRDTIAVMWLTSLFIAVSSGRIYLMISSVIMGIVAIIMSLRSVRKFFLYLPVKRIVGVLLILSGLLGTLIFMYKDNNMKNDLMTMCSTMAFMFGFSFFSEIRAFFKKYQNILSTLFFFCGLLIIGVLIYFNIESPIYLVFISLAIGFITLGIVYNSTVRKIFFEIFLDFF